MINARLLLDELARRGVTEITGVPCSYLTPLINRVASDAAVRYLPATHEGEAVAVAAGSWLAGATTCVIAQNSGLGNMVNPLTSLTEPSRIAIPMIVTWRGEPGLPDEPQHETMGRITLELLSLMGISHTVLPDDPAQLSAALDVGWTAMQGSTLPHAFVLRDGTICAEPLTEPEPLAPSTPEVIAPTEHVINSPSRMSALRCLLASVPDDVALISTTGKTSRELFTLGDRPQHFYLVGAMGSAAAVGMGVARHSQRKVIVIDGDGSALMRLGSLATVAAHAGPGLLHALLDNQVHDSTGGQRSLSSQVNFPAVAVACGYRRVFRCASLEAFAAAIKSSLEEPGPSFVYLRIRPGSASNLGRPDVHPSYVARRFRAFLCGTDGHGATLQGF